MTFTVRALLEPRRAAGAHLRLDGAQHAAAASATAATASSGPTLICRDGARVPLRRDRAADGGAGAVSAPQADARRLEVLVLRRLPALACSTARTSCSRSPSAIQIAYFPEATSAERRGPVRRLARRGLGHDAARRRADPGGPRAVAALLVTIGACATAGGIQALRNFADVEGVDPARLRAPRVHLDARDLDADRRPRQGRPRAARLPDLEGAARRDVLGASCNGAPAATPVDERLHRVQGARHAVRDGRARHAVPRPGHAGGLRRDLPGLRPRLLRLLRPDGDARTSPRSPRQWQELGVERRRHRARPPHLQRERTGLQGGERERA